MTEVIPTFKTKIDKTQQEIDLKDNVTDKFSQNEYLTSLVFHDTDELQKKLKC